MAANTVKVVSTKVPLGRNAVLRTIGLVLLQIFMTALVITFLVPTLWMISSSFKASTEVFKQPIVWIPADPQWSNYPMVFEKLPLFGRFALNTIVITFLAVIGTIISSLMVGYSFSRLRWPGRNFFFALMIATMMLPDVVTLIPRFILFKTFGLLRPELGGGMVPLVLPYWFAASGLYVFFANQYFRGLPVELEEAALIDGADRIQILTQILIPLAKPLIATIGIFALLQHYNEFMTPLIYLSRMENWVLALGVRAINDAQAARWELVFAAATMMFAPVLILFVFAQRYFVQGIAMTGFGGR